MFYRTEGKGNFFESLDAGEYYLQRIYVRPDRQGRNITQKALLLCEKEFEDLAHIYVCGFSKRSQKNRRCYESVGFKDTGKTMEVEPGLMLTCYEKYI